jgi:predicted O-methyltransferase YrrM
MQNLPDIEVVDGTTFELRPWDRVPTNAEWVCLRKCRDYTNRYLELANEFRECRMVEVGVDQGGSTSFFLKLLKPEKLVAIELASQPVQTVTDFLATHDPEGRVQIHWGIDQSDRITVPELLNRTFGDRPLDLVIDDASHLLAPSTATFEMLFPRLRPGGLFVLEDWSGDHLTERALKRALESDVDGKLAGEIAATVAEKGYQPSTPMSILICQLAIAAGRNPDWISEIRATDGICEIRRGAADIPIDTPLADYIGRLGQWIFEPRLTGMTPTD